jgi:glycosyltransferase involved in cell wall biosynthesis
LEDQIFVNEKIKESGIIRPYFMMVSCDLGRKNTISLLKAYRQFIRNNRLHDLVLIWSNPPKGILSEFYKEIEKGKIHIFDFVDDDKLRLLYNGATATFFPSKYEGFGLPVLESMACGTPVVTSRKSSLSEVGGDTAFYSSPEDMDQLEDYMNKFENGLFDKKQLVKGCIKHADKFSWSETAERYIRLYSNCLA